MIGRLLGELWRSWLIEEVSLGSWCTGWQPTSSADNLLTLVFSNSTFRHTEITILRKSKDYGANVEVGGGVRKTPYTCEGYHPHGAKCE